MECIPVRITWKDHYSFGEGSWSSMDDLEEHFDSTGIEHNTVGYLVKETEKAYILISTFSENGTFTQGFLILKADVVRVDFLDTSKD